MQCFVLVEQQHCDFYVLNDVMTFQDRVCDGSYELSGMYHLFIIFCIAAGATISPSTCEVTPAMPSDVVETKVSFLFNLSRPRICTVG